jgi:hypothetical protein
MSSRTVGFLTGAMLCSLALAPATGLAQERRVGVRVEGSTRTLLPRTLVTQNSAAVVKDGNAAHSCSGTSAAGALENATGGGWSGSWADGLGYFVSTIMKETHAGSPDFFSLWVNNRQATTGICQTRVRPGDEVLFLVDRCVFDAAQGGCSNDPVLPLDLRISSRADGGRGAVVRVVSYTIRGKATPVARASLYRNGTFIGKTNARGRRRVRLPLGKTATLQALKRGFARSEPVRALLGG